MVISTLERVQNAFYTKQFFEHYFFLGGGGKACRSKRSIGRSPKCPPGDRNSIPHSLATINAFWLPSLRKFAIGHCHYLIIE